jgi:hypothetical protein
MSDPERAMRLYVSGKVCNTSDQMPRDPDNVPRGNLRRESRFDVDLNEGVGKHMPDNGTSRQFETREQI